jgi:hypothetical protein
MPSEAVSRDFTDRLQQTAAADIHVEFTILPEIVNSFPDFVR